MEGFLDTTETMDARRFMIAIRKFATALSFGTDHSTYLGSGVEYVQSRPYQPGDPARSIDWRVTARTGRYFVKEYEAPKRMPCYVLLDTSASMAVGSTPRTKYEIALHIAGAVALSCLDRVSPVGILGVGEQGLRVEPSLSKNQVMEWMLRLRQFRYDEGTMLSRRIAELTPRLRHRVLVVVLSDLHDPQAVTSLKRMAEQHDCAVVQLHDPAERQLRGAGFMRAREAETGREFVTHGRRDHTDPAVVAAALKKSGVDHLQIRTDQPFAHDVRRFFATRGILGRGAR